MILGSSARRAIGFALQSAIVAGSVLWSVAPAAANAACTTLVNVAYTARDELDRAQYGTPRGLTVAPDGKLWSPFRETPSGVFILDPATGATETIWVPALVRPSGGAFDAAGNFWFVGAMQDNAVARITPLRVVEVQTLDSLPNGRPYDIAVGPNGKLYITLQGENAILVIGDPTNADFGAAVASGHLVRAGISPFAIDWDNGVFNLFGIATGSDGNIWFAEGGNQKAGRLNPGTEVIDEFPLSGPPSAIAASADGYIWFGESNGVPTLEKLSTSSPLSRAQYVLPGGKPADIVAAAEGGAWFTDSLLARIGRIDPAGNVIYPIDSGITGPSYIARLADNSVWFTEEQAIGHFAVNNGGAPPSLSVSVTGGFQSPDYYYTTSHLLVAVTGVGGCTQPITLSVTVTPGTTYTATGSAPSLDVTFPADGHYRIQISLTQDGVTYPQPTPTFQNQDPPRLTPAPPRLNLPASFSVTAPTASGTMLVTYPTPVSATRYDGSPLPDSSIVCTPPGLTGSTFTIGTTTLVSCTATDSAIAPPNSTTGSFSVTVNPPVQQAGPPLLSVPSSFAVTAPTATGTTFVTYPTPVSATRYDGITPLPASSIVCTPAGLVGSTFTIGTTTTVTCTATDAAIAPPNTDTDSFAVTVNAPAPQPCGDAVVALERREKGLEVSGMGSLLVRCGTITVDSANREAIKVSGQGSVVADAVRVVGGTKVTRRGQIQPAPTMISAPVADPLAGLGAPPTAGLANRGKAKVSGGTATLQPGLYDEIDISGKSTVTFAPGVYVMRGGGLKITGQANVSGAGVFFYNTNGVRHDGDPDGKHCGDVKVDGQGTVNLAAPTTGAYRGILLFNDRACRKDVKIAGGSNVRLSGTLYAAGSELEVHGRGSLMLNMPVVVNAVKITGEGDVTLDTRR